jgi:glycosyltransferase involved in cell wall biosynthesis
MVSVVLPTFNRAASLRSAVCALLRQTADADSYQVVVVNNNSTDGTADTLAAIDDPRVVVVHESRQGLSFARNAGIAAATGDVIAFTDDDVEVAPDWIDAIGRAFGGRPDVDAVGGRVLPVWDNGRPSWLTRDYWAPLALQDHGADRLVFDRRNPVGLIGVNVAFRRAVFDRIGLFSPAVQRVGSRIGSTEDHELLTRLYAAEMRALYTPDLLVTTRVPRDRCARAYHRRWHAGHGFFHARMRAPEMERSRRSILGVPGYLVRGAAGDMLTVSRCLLRGDRDGAFKAELRLRFFGGFVRGRLS